MSDQDDLAQIAGVLKDWGPVNGAPMTRNDYQWAIANYGRPNVSLMDAPSPAAWNLMERLGEKDIYKLALQNANAKEDFADQETMAIAKTGLADSIKEEFGEFWSKVSGTTRRKLPTVF